MATWNTQNQNSSNRGNANTNETWGQLGDFTQLSPQNWASATNYQAPQATSNNGGFNIPAGYAPQAPGSAPVGSTATFAPNSNPQGTGVYASGQGINGFDVSGFDKNILDALNESYMQGTINQWADLGKAGFANDPVAQNSNRTMQIGDYSGREWDYFNMLRGLDNGSIAPGMAGGGGTQGMTGNREWTIPQMEQELANVLFNDLGNVTKQAQGQMMQSYNDARGDLGSARGELANANTSLGKGSAALDTANGLLGGEYTNRYNAFNSMLDEINAKLNAGYDEMQGYLGRADTAAGLAQQNLGTLAPHIANQENAYYDMGRNMEELQLAYDNIKAGRVPEETKNYLNQIYDNQMAQANTVLNDNYNQQMTNLIDQLGARGILSSSTSAQTQAGLHGNLMKELQNAEWEYSNDRANRMIDQPYKIFDAATQLYNSRGELVDKAGGLLNSALGIQNAYNQNAGNYLGLAGQANSNYGQLINSTNSQAANGRSSLDALMNQINAYQNQASGYNQNAAGYQNNAAGYQNNASGNIANAQIPNNIYQNAMNPAMDMWGNLLGAETARLTSGQAQGEGPSTGDSIMGALGGALASGVGNAISSGLSGLFS